MAPLPLILVTQKNVFCLCTCKDICAHLGCTDSLFRPWWNDKMQICCMLYAGLHSRLLDCRPIQFWGHARNTDVTMLHICLIIWVTILQGTHCSSPLSLLSCAAQILFPFDLSNRFISSAVCFSLWNTECLRWHCLQTEMKTQVAIFLLFWFLIICKLQKNSSFAPGVNT